jgi:hypothetical protein
MAEVTTLLSAFAQVLDHEIATYRQLLELQRAEKQLVITQALDPLLANLQEKEYLTQRLMQLERAREELLADLGLLLGLSTSSVTLRQLSARLDEPYASAMLDRREQLYTVVTALQCLHRDHAVLLRDSLAFVDNALLFLESMLAAGSTYQQTGEVRSLRQGRFLSGRV